MWQAAAHTQVAGSPGAGLKPPQHSHDTNMHLVLLCTQHPGPCAVQYARQSITYERQRAVLKLQSVQGDGSGAWRGCAQKTTGVRGALLCKLNSGLAALCVQRGGACIEAVELLNRSHAVSLTPCPTC